MMAIIIAYRPDTISNNRFICCVVNEEAKNIICQQLCSFIYFTFVVNLCAEYILRANPVSQVLDSLSVVKCVYKINIKLRMYAY